jgi:hypothetical protein
LPSVKHCCPGHNFFFPFNLETCSFQGMHSNLASFKKPKIQFGQCQDAQTPIKPVAKLPTFIMPTFKTTQRQKQSKTANIQNAYIQNAQFVVSRLVLHMRTKKYCSLITEQFNMAFLAITQ